MRKNEKNRRKGSAQKKEFRNGKNDKWNFFIRYVTSRTISNKRESQVFEDIVLLSCI